MSTPPDGLAAVGAQVLSVSEDPDHEVCTVAGRRLVDDPENTAVSEQAG